MKLPANFQCGRIKDNCIWFFDNLYKCICKMDIVANTVETVAGGYWDFICATTYINCDNIYFVSVNEINVIIYNTKDNTVKKIRHKYEREDGMCFWPLEYDNKIFFAHQTLNLKKVFCYFDCQKEKFCEVNQAKDKVKKLLENEIMLENPLINPCNYASQRFGVIRNTNKYFKYDFFTGDGEVFTLNRQVELFAVRYDGNNVWALQCNDNSILKIGSEIKEFKIDTIAEEPFSYIYILKKYIVVLPRFSDVVVLIDKETEEVHTIKVPINREYSLKYPKMLDCCEYNDKIYLFPLGLKDLYVLDETDLTIQIIEPDYLDFEKMKNDLEIHKLRKSLEYSPIVIENEKLNCELFIKFIKDENVRPNLEETNKKSIGEEIWRYFSSNLKN